MSREPQQLDTSGIALDFLAEKVASDPSKQMDAVALRGFVGRSTEVGNIRLYVDATFQTYYEISTADILHSQQLSRDVAPLGGSLLYVRRAAQVRRVAVSADVQAQFLQGPLSSIAPGASSFSSLSDALVARQGRRRISIDRCPSDDRTSCSDVCPGHGGGGGGGPGLTDDGCVVVYWP